VEKLIIGYQTLQFKIAKSRKNVEEIFQHHVADPESFPAIKSWEAREPSTQYRQVS
jgi:hypothetical protein